MWYITAVLLQIPFRAGRAVKNGAKVKELEFDLFIFFFFGVFFKSKPHCHAAGMLTSPTLARADPYP